MTKPLTILDIARLAGVGKSTVSRVLNNDVRVKDTTRAKVQGVIDQYDFFTLEISTCDARPAQWCRRSDCREA